MTFLLLTFSFDRLKLSANNFLRLFVCLFVFYGVSTFVGYLMPIPFSTNKQFYYKQSNLALVHSLIAKNILFQVIQLSQTVLLQTV